MKKFREFPEWSFEQVEEVARMLYALAPFDVNEREKTRWNLLVRKAFSFLDNLHKACDEIAEQRRERGKHYAGLSVQLTETAKLPEIVPFNKAARIVTGERSTTRAVPKLNKVLKRLPKYVSSEELRRWQNHGIPRNLLIGLKRVFKIEWKIVIAELSSAKRAKRTDKRRGGKRPKAERRLQPALSELAKLGKKVDLT